MIRLRNIMSKPVITISEDRTVAEAAHLMSTNNIGCLIVVSDGKPVGIITERDILKKVVVPNKPPHSTKVSDVMSKPLITGSPDMDVVYAAKLMISRNIKRLPIVENGKLVGIVTFTDLIRSYPQLAESLESLLSEMPNRFKKLLRK